MFSHESAVGCTLLGGSLVNTLVGIVHVSGHTQQSPDG